MNTPAISVAMSVYNGARFLAGAIESVLGQTFGDFEFLILDDGSTDATPEIIRHYAAADARIRPIIRENRGLVASLNQLVDETHAPLIARMDADDLCRPERFARQIAFLAGNPDYGVVGCWSEDIDENDGPYSVTGPDHPTDHKAFLAAIDHGWPLLCHPAVMMRRDAVRSVGGYHAAFRHCEDLDLWLRLASVTKLCSVPERLIRYRHYPERKAGRPDPTEHLAALPPLDQLDALFGREGVARAVRATVAPQLLYSLAGLRDHGFDLVVDHLREGGRPEGMWRTVARLVRFGEPARAARLAATLALARAA